MYFPDAKSLAVRGTLALNRAAWALVNLSSFRLPITSLFLDGVITNPGVALAGLRGEAFRGLGFLTPKTARSLESDRSIPKATTVSATAPLLVEFTNLRYLKIDGLAVSEEAFYEGCLRSLIPEDAIRKAIDAIFASRDGVAPKDLTAKYLDGNLNIARSLSGNGIISGVVATPEQSLEACLQLASQIKNLVIALPDPAQMERSRSKKFKSFAEKCYRSLEFVTQSPAARGPWDDQVLKYMKWLEGSFAPASGADIAKQLEQCEWPDRTVDPIGWSAKFEASFAAVARHAERIPLPMRKAADNYYLANPKKFAPGTEAKAFFDDHLIANYSDQCLKLSERQLHNANMAYCEIRSKQNWDYSYSPYIKYMDHLFWTDGKLSAAKTVGLANLRGKRVLDIGSGPGHFGLVCDYFGADYLGVDVWSEKMGFMSRRPVFDDLSSVFGIKRVDLEISPGVDFLELGAFDTVTCLMGNFCQYETESGGRSPWDISRWKSFFARVADSIMHDQTQFHFQLGRPLIPDEVHLWLSEFCQEANRERSVYKFNAEGIAKIL